jgi:hypothetical protein
MVAAVEMEEAAMEAAGWAGGAKAAVAMVVETKVEAARMVVRRMWCH